MSSAANMSVVATSRSAVAPMSSTSARGGAGLGPDERHDLVLGDVRVHERQRDVRPDEQEPRDRLGRGMALRVGVDHRRRPGSRPRTAMYGRLAW